MTNCAIAWNTQPLQRAADRESHRLAPRYSIDALCSSSPVGHRHIDFRGTYRFPVERYAARLLASAAQSRARARQQKTAGLDTKRTRAPGNEYSATSPIIR